MPPHVRGDCFWCLWYWEPKSTIKMGWRPVSEIITNINRMSRKPMKAFEENSIEKAIQLLDGYKSTVDYPANTFGPKWLQKFPAQGYKFQLRTSDWSALTLMKDAKFILTIRESPEEWYKSASTTILPSSDSSNFKDLFDRWGNINSVRRCARDKLKYIQNAISLVSTSYKISKRPENWRWLQTNIHWMDRLYQN